MCFSSGLFRGIGEMRTVVGSLSWCFGMPSHLGPPGTVTGPGLSLPRSKSTSTVCLCSTFHILASLCFRSLLSRSVKNLLLSLLMVDGKMCSARIVRCLLRQNLEASTTSPTGLQWAAMTHGEVMHSQAKFIVTRRLSYLQVPCILSILILTHLYIALASFEVELHGVNRKTTTFLL